METLLLMPALVFTLLIILGLVFGGVIVAINQGKWKLLGIVAIVVFLGIGYWVFSSKAYDTYKYPTYLYETKIAIESSNDNSYMKKKFYANKVDRQKEVLEDISNASNIEIGKYGEKFRMNNAEGGEIIALYFDTLKNNAIIILWVIVAFICAGVSFSFSKKAMYKALDIEKLDKDIDVKTSNIKKLEDKSVELSNKVESIEAKKVELVKEYKLVDSKKVKSKKELSELEARILAGNKELRVIQDNIRKLKTEEKDLVKKCKDLSVVIYSEDKSKKLDIDDMLDI